MAETRTIAGHGQHSAQGPHFDLPGDFVPLRLCCEAFHLHIVVVCPWAVVGRHTDADLRFAFPDVSRHHCRLAFESGLWRIYDMNSTNGIYVNNSALADATLYTGDLIRIGGVQLLVESGTQLRLSRAEEETNNKLRQIVKVLPAVG